MRYRPEIDGLRALAVLPVMLYHAGLSIFSGGYVGVDIFFVISGFLITGILLEDLKNGRFSIIKFYERRCRRILPPLTFMAVAVTIAAWIYLVPVDLRDYGRSLAAMATFWVNLFYYRSAGYFGALAETKPLLHTWSLSVEEQFYIVFPLILWLLYKKARRHLLWVMFALAGVSLFLSAYMLKKNPEAVFYLLHFRAWELLAGSLLAAAPRCPKLSKAPMAGLGLLGLTLLGAPVFLYSHQTAFPGLAALPPCLGAGLLIFIHGQGLQNSLVGRLLAQPIMVGIGKISYSLYLWHWPLLMMPKYIKNAPLNAVETSLAVAATFGLAIFSWRFFEQPVRTKSFLKTSKTLFIASLGILMVLVAAGRGLKYGKGFPERLPESARYFALGTDDRDQTTIQPYCFANISRANDQLPIPCRIGPAAGGEAAFIVWGDSFAHMWKPALDLLTEEYHINGYMAVAAACNPLLNPTAGDSYQDINCNAFNQQMLSFVAEQKAQHVLMGIAYNKLVEDDMDYVEKSRQPQGPFADRLEERGRELTELGVTLWLLESPPIYQNDVPAALTKAILQGKNIDELGQSAEDTQKRADYMRSVVKRLQSQGIKIYFVEIAPDLCPDDWCRPGDSQGAYYFDSLHLSGHAVKKFQHVLKPMFREITAERKTQS